MTSQNLLQQLRRLERSSSGFHDQLSNILYGGEYTRCVEGLQGDNLVWLVDYLDEVSCCVALLRLYSSQRRPSIFSILPVPVSGNVFENSAAYVAPGQYYQPHTFSRLQFSISVIDLSPQEVPGISSKGLSTV